MCCRTRFITASFRIEPEEHSEAIAAFRVLGTVAHVCFYSFFSYARNMKETDSCQRIAPRFHRFLRMVTVPCASPQMPVASSLWTNSIKPSRSKRLRSHPNKVIGGGTQAVLCRTCQGYKNKPMDLRKVT